MSINSGIHKEEPLFYFVVFGKKGLLPSYIIVSEGGEVNSCSFPYTASGTPGLTMV